MPDLIPLHTATAELIPHLPDKDLLNLLERAVYNHTVAQMRGYDAQTASHVIILVRIEVEKRINKFSTLRYRLMDRINEVFGVEGDLMRVHVRSEEVQQSISELLTEFGL